MLYLVLFPLFQVKVNIPSIEFKISPSILASNIDFNISEQNPVSYKILVGVRPIRSGEPELLTGSVIMAEEGNDLLNGLVAGYLDKVSPGISKKFKVCQYNSLFSC